MPTVRPSLPCATPLTYFRAPGKRSQAGCGRYFHIKQDILCPNVVLPIIVIMRQLLGGIAERFEKCDRRVHIFDLTEPLTWSFQHQCKVAGIVLALYRGRVILWGVGGPVIDLFVPRIQVSNSFVQISEHQFDTSAPFSSLCVLIVNEM